MQINPTHPFVRMASFVARRYQDQIRREIAVTLGQRFVALDYGLAPTRASVLGGGLPITVVPDRVDPLEQLWHLPGRHGRKVVSSPHDDTTRPR